MEQLQSAIIKFCMIDNISTSIIINKSRIMSLCNFCKLHCIPLIISGLPDRYDGKIANVKGVDDRANTYGTYLPHAIDPAVFYDEAGTLWMTYGSWSQMVHLFYQMLIKQQLYSKPFHLDLNTYSICPYQDYK